MRASLLLFAGLIAFAQNKPSFEEILRLVRSESPDAAPALVAAMGEDNLKQGNAVLYRGGEFVFAIRSQREPLLVINDEAPRAMRQIGTDSDLWALAATVQTSRSHNFHYLVANEVFGGRTDVPAFGPYAYERPGAPQGRLSEKMVHTSKIYPGMVNDWWYYVPAQYNPNKPAAVMVWQDGQDLVPRDGRRAQIVFDNLTQEGLIPVIIHVFVSPGTLNGRRHRSVQYDSVDDTYPRYILEEILPQVAAKYKLRTDGYSRAIAGNSSGGIAAFNAAWQKPDEFSRVLSRIGSFTSIQWKPGEKEGGNIFPFAVRKQPKRNIRVWLQDGSGDLENSHGSWPLQNIAMANSLKMRGYDYHLSWGNGTHNGAHGNAELAEELIWLWRGYDPSKTSQEFVQDAAERAKPMWRVRALNRE
jgi:enterochelin esterase-like enzyme